MVPTASRRSFLKAGLLGAIVLSAAGGLYRMSRPAMVPQRFRLDESAHAVLAALIPVVLKDAVAPGSADADAALARTLDAIAGLPLSAQKELQDLFALLSLGPARRLLAGLPDDWSAARAEDVAAFLQDWRTSRLGLLQSAYHGLHDLILGPWYSHESTWAAIGYPGPIEIPG